MESLCVMFYGGVDLKVARARIRTNIHQLNEALVETDARVRSRRNSVDGATFWLEVEGRPYGKA